jgi:hypothetical protein
MTKINDILILDLQEDIKHVIDLEDRSEHEIQQEIESYIVTEGIGRHLYNFTNQITSNIKETGVWLSGFYGSGKSYFGKMLGYIIANPVINGTRARDRFIPRLKGVSDESLIENTIRNLDAINSRVIFLDVAKQNTDQGLAFTLFVNLLKSLGFREDLYGYIEFDLYLNGKYDEFKLMAKKVEDQNWDELKKNKLQVAKAMRNIFYQMGYSETDYEETRDVFNAAIQNFSAGKFRDELERYLNFNPDETLVFIFDEASEAISQNKFTLLDLEGLSEALSSIQNKVWTIAIAQEKLDDVINNASVTRNQLTKVTDRFKTKIHLEATEVDVIIRSRLLQKKEQYFQQLKDYYKTNDGLISDATNLKSSFPTKTTSADEFAVYYPFHRYQFDLLQKFLFSSNALVATQIAARGMIITAFDVLRKQMRDQELYAFTPGYAICSEAQTAPPVGLINKYDTARKILKEKNILINGEKLLKTIHLLADSQVLTATAENITKSYMTAIDAYYTIKPDIETALSCLVEDKVLLVSNNTYKITSDMEGKLLEEMKGFDIELYTKKRNLINYIKDYKTFVPVATLTDNSGTFKFSVVSDQDDELTSSGSKQLKLVVYSLFNINEDRQDFIEQVKMDTQHHKDLMTLIPDNADFPYIDKLIEEIKRYSIMEEKYTNESDPAKRQIIKDFAAMREEKEKDLRLKIDQAYKNGSLVYMFDEHLLDADTFKAIINDIQRKVVKNIYFKRLPTQLSESMVPKIFTGRKEILHTYFTGQDFSFFDKNGNFVGENLKVVEEITAKIKKTQFVDGKTLETDLSGPPWGYSFGTIVVTLAVLLRAGRLSVKYNSDIWFSHKQTTVHEAFNNATKFKSASFKSITQTLTAVQKNSMVQLLMDMEADRYINKKVDWNTTDFELSNAVNLLADHFIGALTTLKDTVNRFDALFPKVAEQKLFLQQYTGKLTENNYIDKALYFIDTGDQFKASIRTILKAQKFIKKNFSKVKDFKRFIEAVEAELKKADRVDEAIQEASEEFSRLYKQDMVKNFGQMQQQAQVVKDAYYLLIKNAGAGMTHEYQILDGKVDAAIRSLKQNYPAELNVQYMEKLENLKQYCQNRIIKEPDLEFSTTCKRCGYSLSDILNYTALVPTKDSELLILQSSFIKETPPPKTIPDDPDPPISPEKVPRKITFRLPGKTMKVKDYKDLLTKQLTELTAASPDEEIEVDFETL